MDKQNTYIENIKKYPIRLLAKKLVGAVSICTPLSKPKSGTFIMEEIWKDIPGFEGFYQVSNLGRIKSLDRIKKTQKGSRKYKGFILKPSIGSHGYYVVNLCCKSYCVHRLVISVFLTNHLKKTDVNHKDFNKLNNNIENLEWCTRSENMIHASNGGHVLKGENHKYSQLNEFQVRVIKKTKGLYQRELGEVFNVSRNVIRFILNGRSWKHI